MKIFFGLDACLTCGSFFNRISGLCESCENKIVSRSKLQAREVRLAYRGTFECLSLFQWRPGESDLFSQMILQLKGPYQKKTWNFLAHKMAYALIENNLNFRQKTWLTCCPSKTGEPDHAWNWAQGLSKALEIPFVPLLKYPRRQALWRRKSRSERLGLVGEKREVFTLLPPAPELLEKIQKDQGRILFADDIITTGATASLAFESLGKPRNFTHLALANRTDIARLR